ncbi:MAG: hypothetical protein WEB88_14920 [Gemmatimonadota bacterium]
MVAFDTRTAMLTGGLVLALLIAGCADGQARTAFTVAVRDSAGVQIVENRGAEVPDSMVLREVVEEMRIGTVDGPAETQLHLVMDVTEDDTGRIYLTDNGSVSVKVFAPDGAYLRAFGGPGNGPGEFPRAVVFTWLRGDTVNVMAVGERHRRVVAFSGAGEAIATREAVLPSGASFYQIRGGGPGGWLAVQNDQSTDPGADASDLLVWVDLARGTVLDTVVRVPTRTTYRISEQAGSDWPLFAPFPDWQVAPDGKVIMHAGGPYEYRVHAADGSLVRVVRRQWAARPVDDAVVDRYRQLLGERYDTRIERRLGLPRPDVFPPLGSMVVGADGSVWIRRNDQLHADVARTEWLFTLDREAAAGRGVDVPARWDVFDAEGRFLAAVELPARFTPHVVDGDRVTGVQLDDMDVEYVVRYRVEGLDAYHTLGRD